MLTFSGKFDEWISFHNMFHGLNKIRHYPTCRRCNIIIIISQERDLRCIIISSLKTSAENYKEAWQMLKSRYDDPELIVKNHKGIIRLASHEQGQSFHTVKAIEYCIEAHPRIMALKRLTDHWDNLLIHLTNKLKLDQLTYKEWETIIQRGKIPEFKQLINFLNQR